MIGLAALAASGAESGRVPGPGSLPFARSPWATSVGAQAAWQPDADLHAGGKASTTIADAQAGITRAFGPRRSAGLAVGYGVHDYRFSGDGFAATAPWDQVDVYSLSAPVRASLENGWTVIGIPAVRSRLARGAALADGLTGGGMIVTTYRVNECLQLGPGLGAFSELEDDPTVFPFLAVDWTITPTLSLSTGRGQGASRGPGLALAWQAREALTAGIAGRYEQMRFRLDDSGAQPAGVGEDRGFAAVAFISYDVAPRLRLGGFAGFEMGRTLSIDDTHGHRAARSDLDAAPTMGLSLTRAAW